MRIYWTEEEENILRNLYIDKGLSVSELFEEFIKIYPSRTLIALKIKIKKLKLRHTKEQTFEIKSRLNSGKKNGMFGVKSWANGKTKNDDIRLKNASIKNSITRKELYKQGKIDTSGVKNGMFGKDSWSKGKTKYDDNRLLEHGKKMSVIALNRWNNLTQEQKDFKIGILSLASNKAKKDTKIEIIIMNILEKMCISFEKNFRCNRFIFDFYLFDYNFVIECQGDYWHGNEEYFKELNDIQIANKARDEKKEKYLLENNINYIFIWENVIYRDKHILEEILWQHLKKIHI